MGQDKGFLKTENISDTDLGKIRELRKSDPRTSLLIFSPDGVQTVSLREGRSIIIGRLPPADVPIRDGTLSRQHVCVELSKGEVWVEDLGSTNGTWVDGRKVERQKIDPQSDLVFGAVPASLVAEPSELRNLGLESHDRFQRHLDAEISRAQTFGRELSLLMLRRQGTKTHFWRWFPRVRKHLRPFDTVALYSRDTVEVLLPESSLEQVMQLAQKLISKEEPLLFGLAVLPQHASSTEEIVDVACTALHRATRDAPIQVGGSEDGTKKKISAGAPMIRSKAMKEVLHTIERVAASAIPVLIHGETGTGKEVAARTIHNQSKRKDSPMICVNCGGIPDQLVESHLFGHEKGAFTGAEAQGQGVFEAADTGTVLLDEIGELPAVAQAALLRVLETKRFCRVGSSKEVEVDVRILAATHRDLEKMCRSGEFREDLLYRLNAITLEVPPLRERKEEIDRLARIFIEQANDTNERDICGIDDEAKTLLERYDWPGNVRELRNAMERAVVLAQGKVIGTDDLPERIRGLEGAKQTVDLRDDSDKEAEDEVINLRADLERREVELIVRALSRSDWDRKKAARALGLPLRTLAHKIQTHGIKRDE